LASLYADKSAGTHVDDSVLHSKVKAKLIGDNFFRGMGVNIEVSRGVVLLAGFVDSEKQRDKIGSAAAGVDGVVRVSNQLRVKSGDRSTGQAVDDTLIASQVKAKLGSDLSINVEVHNGEVLLSGFADTLEEKEAAIEAARYVKYVKKVISGIEIAD
jgi:osmotically-inducible protein OsmY